MKMTVTLIDGDIVNVGDFVLVSFQQKSVDVYYVGLITVVCNDTGFDVSFLRNQMDVFVYPLIEDVSQIYRKDIYCILTKPKSLAGTNGNRAFI